VLYEPFGKNTSAAIGLLCKRLLDLKQEKNVVAIFPADHLIANTQQFEQAIRLAEKSAQEGRVVTLGITPTFPSTGYGYIELERAEKTVTPVKAVRFREKPDQATAESYIKTGKFVWNAGIFVFRADRMIELMQKHLPDVWGPISKLSTEFTELKTVYAQVPAVSIDVGIMEKLADLVCIPCADLGWSDVGSWDEVAKLSKNSESMQELRGGGNFVYSRQEGKKYSLVGTQDLIVVDTADALLVVKKGDSQYVKDAQQKFAQAKEPVATQHPYEYRPWGYFEILRDTDQFKSKVIRVEPGQQLSYQSHAKRAEHWIIISGNPEVVLNDEVHKPQPGEHIYIPLGAKHRIRNLGKEVVEFVEVQVGSYFGEDDIVRYQDDYQRK
jgi:mannose-1-phosphate guanylyltransferase/mannose-6-phosphate isomerase